METEKVIRTELDSFEFGFWDEEVDEISPLVTAEQIAAFCERTDFRKLLVDGISMSFATLKDAYIDDLRAIWKRLDRIEGGK